MDFSVPKVIAVENAGVIDMIHSRYGTQHKIHMISGKAETLVSGGLADACVAIVESGNTLEENHLFIVDELYKPFVCSYAIKDTPSAKTVQDTLIRHVFIGYDGTGKTSLTKEFQKRGVNAQDRWMELDEATFDVSKFFSLKKPDNVQLILCECAWKTWETRAYFRENKDKWDKDSHLFHLFSFIYRMMLWHYGGWIVRTDNNVVDTANMILQNKDTFMFQHIPSMATIDPTSLPIVMEGNSRILRDLSQDYYLIQFKNNVFSYTQNRAETISETGNARLQSFRSLLTLMHYEHSYLLHDTEYIGSDFIVARKGEVPPIEVLCKAYPVGSDSHLYENLLKNNKLFNADAPLLTYHDRPVPRYKRAPLVKATWRNEISYGKDEIMTDDYMEQLFDDWDKVKTDAKNSFRALERSFRHIDSEAVLIDCCFIYTTTGHHIYEFSPDMLRMSWDMDKDVFRKGSSTEETRNAWNNFAKKSESSLQTLLTTLQ